MRSVSRTANAGILLHWLECIEGAKCARPRPCIVLHQPMFGEWLSLVEHLLREQGVGGSNPLSPTILSISPSGDPAEGLFYVMAGFVAP